MSLRRNSLSAIHRTYRSHYYRFVYAILTRMTQCHWRGYNAATNSKVRSILSIQYRCADFIEEINPKFTNGSTTALVEASKLRPFRSKGGSLESGHADILQELLRDWGNGDGIVGQALR